MFHTKDVLDLAVSTNSNDRLVAEYWMTKEKYKNLLHYVSNHGADFVKMDNLNHLALRLNDIRIAAAINHVDLGSVEKIQKRLDKQKAKAKSKVKETMNEVKEAEKEIEAMPEIGVFVSLNKICEDFFDSPLIKKAKK